MRESFPKIHAVVEVAARRHGLWFELPSEPWPRFVRLSRATTGEEVALVVGTLCCYGNSQDEPPSSAEALANAFPQALRGGFAVVDQGRTISPSCCCGLETWRDWTRVLSGGGSPWTGHHPSPLVEVLEGNVQLWSDGATGRKPPAESPIVFTSEQFEKAVRRAATDLEGFVFALYAWLEMHAPHQARRISENFRRVFVSGQG
jgi:hypothetical protein